MGYPYYVWLCAHTCRLAGIRNLPFPADKACHSIGVPYHPFYRRYPSNGCDRNLYHALIHHALNKNENRKSDVRTFG